MTPLEPITHGAAYARAVIAAAAEAEAAEYHLKEAVLLAARAGDCGRVERIVARWLAEPAAEILKDGLD